jgi:hypothetical protein
VFAGVVKLGAVMVWHEVQGFVVLKAVEPTAGSPTAHASLQSIAPTTTAHRAEKYLEDIFFDNK